MAKKPTKKPAEAPVAAAPVQPDADTGTIHTDGVQTLPVGATDADQQAATSRVDEPRPLSDFAVAPIAPEDGTAEAVTSADPHTGSAAWAVRAFAGGSAVRRASWIGAKALDPNHHEGRIILHRDDLMARDWVFA